MTEEDILSAFESIGIPKMQTLVYLDLLKNQESTATQISKRTGMHRANIYDTLTKLRKRNLVYLNNRDGKTLFAALSTDLIIDLEKDKLVNLESAMNSIKSIYLNLHTPRVYTVEGCESIKNMLFSLLEKKVQFGFTDL